MGGWNLALSAVKQCGLEEEKTAQRPGGQGLGMNLRIKYLNIQKDQAGPIQSRVGGPPPKSSSPSWQSV